MPFGLEEFKESPLGRQIGAILEHPQWVAEMVVFSKHGMPAVQAIGKELLRLGPEVRQDQVKKTVGRWVREILEENGLTVWKQRRVTPGNLFSTGMVYRSKTAASETRVSAEAKKPLSASERAAVWREGAKNLPRTEPLSDEAISRESLYAGRG